MKKITAYLISMMMLAAGIGTFPVIAEAEPDPAPATEPFLPEDAQEVFVISAVIKPEYLEIIKPEAVKHLREFDGRYLNAALKVGKAVNEICQWIPGTASINGVKWEHEQPDDTELLLILDARNSSAADLAMERLEKSGFFTSLKKNWTDQEEADTSLPYQTPDKDSILGGVLMTLVRFDHRNDADQWDAAALNQLAEINTISSVSIVFTDGLEGRVCMNIRLKDDSYETAVSTAKALYATELFYSIEHDSRIQPAQNETKTGLEEPITPIKLLPGDANNDESVDILDVIAVNKCILGIQTLNTLMGNVDLNGNSKVESDDALAILKIVLGITD